MTTLSIIGLIISLNINDNQHNDAHRNDTQYNVILSVILLSVILQDAVMLRVVIGVYRYVEPHNDVCHYAEFRYAECRQNELGNA